MEQGLNNISSNAQYTGYWINLTNLAQSPLTSTELMTLSTTGAQGLWVWQDTQSYVYNLTIISGSDLTNANPYAENDGMDIQADAAPAGKVFDKWVSDNGGSFGDETNPTTTFIMPAGDVTLTATYTDAPTLSSDYTIFANNLTYSIQQVKANPNLLQDSKANASDKNGMDLNPNSSLRLLSTTLAAKEGVYAALIGVGDDGSGNQSDNSQGKPSGDNKKSPNSLMNKKDNANTSPKLMSKLNLKKALPQTGEQSSSLIWRGLSLLILSVVWKRKRKL
jgi:uncharacterized repeat protein (TIGR02543 family)/LPXTG-motif cell wall-anchored protein